MKALSTHVKTCKKFTTVTAKKGDVLLLHGLLPHSASRNHVSLLYLSPETLLTTPFSQSLLERVILRNHGCDSLPEWKAMRERKFWYPHNTGFKRAKAEGD